MTPTQPLPIVIALAANDLPELPATERARRRPHERRLRGPIWSSPATELETA